MEEAGVRIRCQEYRWCSHFLIALTHDCSPVKVASMNISALHTYVSALRTCGSLRTNTPTLIDIAIHACRAVEGGGTQVAWPR